MPQPNDRHAKSSWEWGTAPSRSQQRDAAVHDDPVHSSVPSKKKHGACKGDDGWHDAHDFIFVMTHHVITGQEMTCEWQAYGTWFSKSRAYSFIPRWVCHHELRCSRCGYLEKQSWTLTQSGECPLHPHTSPPQSIIDQCAKEQAAYEARLARRTWGRKPPITGRQGYRKPKKEG